MGSKRAVLGLFAQGYYYRVKWIWTYTHPNFQLLQLVGIQYSGTSLFAAFATSDSALLIASVDSDSGKLSKAKKMINFSATQTRVGLASGDSNYIYVTFNKQDKNFAIIKIDPASLDILWAWKSACSAGNECLA